MLVKNGVPYQAVFGEIPPEVLKRGLPEEDIASYAIIFGELDGGKFDWNAWAWVKRE